MARVINNYRDPALNLRSLHERHVGLTEALAGSYLEAASVCLNRHHESPVDMEVSSNKGKNLIGVSFDHPDERVQNAWANDIDTTECGAYCVSLAAVEHEEQLVAVRRAETQSGADWYVAPIGTGTDDLEDCLRLEVSGTDSGNRTKVEARLKEKIDQALHGNSNLPALAAVVGFKEKLIAIQRVSESE